MVLYLRSHEVAVLYHWDLVQHHEVGGFHNHGIDFHDAMEPPWQLENLNSIETKGCGSIRIARKWENVANEEFDGVNVVVAEGADDVDGDEGIGGVAS